MNAEATRIGPEAEIRGILDQWRQAVCDKDVPRIVSRYAHDIVAYDAILQLQFRGVEAYRAHWEKCMTMCTGPTVFELHELQVFAGDDVAFAHALNRCGGTGPDGKEMTGWMRMTVGYRRSAGSWQVVHEHFSAPFDMESSQVLWLEP